MSLVAAFDALPTAVVNADRAAGPYVVAATMLDTLVPLAMKASPDLVATHDIEIRAVAPAWQERVATRRSVLADRLPADQRILFPGPRRILWLANGIAEFVGQALRRAGRRWTVIVENLTEADLTDLLLLQVLQRRVDSGLLRVVTHEGLVKAPACKCATPDLPSMLTAMTRYRREGYHHALSEVGHRALALLSHDEDPELWWHVVHVTAGALAATGFEDLARALYDEGRRRSTDPVNRATAAYATAMLLVRHHDPAHRDPEEAMAWINEAITITTLLPDRRQRAFHLSFDLNGRALIELRRGRLHHAAALVEEAIALVERDLDPSDHPIHRLILRTNRAQLRARQGRPAEALTDLNEAVAIDPDHPDPYLERGKLHYQMGRLDQARADFDRFIALALPAPEAFYNRAQLHYAQGDYLAARADLSRALDLDPDFTPARVNRAGLCVVLGDNQAARADIQYDPDHPHLQVVLAQVHAAAGDLPAALTALDGALARNPLLVSGWATRGALALEAGNSQDAIEALTRALQLEESAALLFNRGLAWESADDLVAALADFERAAALDPEDLDIRMALLRLKGGTEP